MRSGFQGFRVSGFQGSRRRGSVMVVAIGVIVVLAGLLLVYAQEMRVEVQAAGNRACALQAGATVRGALAYANNHLVGNHDPISLDTEMQCEANSIGDGYFWMLRPDPLDETRYAFGLSDESSKLNINTATFDMLMCLPNMTSELAGSILDWRDADDDENSNGGAENAYYLALSPESYYCKNAPFETLEELLLVKGATPQILYGVDANHNGVVDAGEDSAGGSGGLQGINGQARCGIMKYLTVYSQETNVSSTGKARLNVNQASTDELESLLSKAVTNGQLDEIMLRTRRKPFSSVFDFYYKTGMSLDDFKTIVDKITVNPAKTTQGLINVNTAPKEVLACLPGLDSGDPDALVTARLASGSDLSSIAWVLNALPQKKAVGIANFITVKTTRFSADVIGASGDGRGYKRVRCVFDVSGTTPAILYHKDLSALGWPLAQDVLSGLRAGKAPVPGASAGATGLSSSLSGSSGGLH